MIPRTLVATAQIPNGPEMRLYSRGADHMILLERDELMSTRMSGSEEALATLTAERLGTVKGQRWLIGGYGMGFTLRAALRVLPRDAEVVVAELVPEIIDWAKGPMAGLTAGCLEDPRVRIVNGDVAGEIARGDWDAILLDVDNGPDALVRAQNQWLYEPGGLAVARTAIRRGGLLAIWSAGADPRFTKTLQSAGFRVDEQVVAARHNGKGPRHTIWFASPR
ncbi:spermidine synthase [Sphingomonas astaxanthinifaciens]|uniref:Spermidine synthase n=1 Tax=Sphingomonas astaxanthinifaciens DSM 22298 TaxID=1123267 RepID=A0ABQ5Z118_9SPHN|nr:spermidine synthase [Sphingomonas astaxanthinifaciens]GLR46448.1 spermidine synthase [Sphingomonas astaxanthinifaciens DSM 22298]